MVAAAASEPNGELHQVVQLYERNLHDVVYSYRTQLTAACNAGSLRPTGFWIRGSSGSLFLTWRQSINNVLVEWGLTHTIDRLRLTEHRCMGMHEWSRGPTPCRSRSGIKQVRGLGNGNGGKNHTERSARLDQGGVRYTKCATRHRLVRDVDWSQPSTRCPRNQDLRKKP